MGRPSKMSILKRQRENKRLEKAAQKREIKDQRKAEGADATDEPTTDDLEGYGVIHAEESPLETTES